EGPDYDPGGADSTLDTLRIEALGGQDVLINWTALPGTLVGGYGNDVLQGGFGDDILDGQNYADVYVYSTRPLPADDQYHRLAVGGITVNDSDPAWGEQLGRDTIREPLDGDIADTIDLAQLGAAVGLDLAAGGEQVIAPGRLSLIDVA